MVCVLSDVVLLNMNYLKPEKHFNALNKWKVNFTILNWLILLGWSLLLLELFDSVNIEKFRLTKESVSDCTHYQIVCIFIFNLTKSCSQIYLSNNGCLNVLWLHFWPVKTVIYTKIIKGSRIIYMLIRQTRVLPTQH